MVSTSGSKMKGGVGYRLSPNEAARVIQEEKERRRKLRIVQVREMAKANAAKIRQAVKEEHKNQMKKLSKQVKSEWEAEKEEKIRKLQEQYDANLNQVGEGHAEAVQHELNAEDRVLIAIEDNKKAEQRHRAAMKKLHDDRNKQAMEDNKQIVARQIALDMEKARAAHIASLPPPAADPLYDIAIPRVKSIKMTDLNAFSTTHYHIPQDVAVERATREERELIDARNAAKVEQTRYDETNTEIEHIVHERREKARLRHKHAREKELLKQDYEQMLHDLSDLRRDDIHRRQQIVAKIPKQIYVPPHRRLEEDNEEQLNMERAFEDMYMAATDHQGNLSLALDLHEPPSSTPTATLDLSTADDSSLSRTQHESSGQESETIPMQLYIPKGRPASGVYTGASSSGDVTSVSEQGAPLHDITNQGLREKDVIDKTKPPDSGLRRLLGRIRNQRETTLLKANRQVEDMSGPSNRLQRDDPPIRIPVTSQSTSDTGASEQIEGTPSLTQYTITSTTTNSEQTRSGTHSTTPTLEMGTFTSTLTSPQRSQGSPGKSYASPPRRQGGPTTKRASPGKKQVSPSRPQASPGKKQTSPQMGGQGTSKSRGSPGRNKSGGGERSTTETLLHPMEHAARLRKQPLGASGGEVTAFLSQEKERQTQIRAEHLRIKEQTEQYLREIEKQRSELEKKYVEIEARKEAYKSQLSEYTLPNSEAETTQRDIESHNMQRLHTPRKGISHQTHQHVDYPDARATHLLQPALTSGGRVLLDTSAGHGPSFSADTSNTTCTSREEEHIKRIKDYQSKLLERQKQKNSLIEERQGTGNLERGTEWLQTRTEGEGQNLVNKDMILYNQKPDLSADTSIPLSAQMASGQYFGTTDRSTGYFRDTVPNTGYSYPAVKNLNMGVPLVSGALHDVYAGTTMHKSNDGAVSANMQPPEQVTDSPNHRVQDWLSFYQQLEQLSSKEQSPLNATDSYRPLTYDTTGETSYLDRRIQGVGKDVSNYSGRDVDALLPDTRVSTNVESHDQPYGLASYSRHLLHDARENVLKAEKNLYSTIRDNGGTSAEFRDIKDLYDEHKEAMDSFSSSFGDARKTEDDDDVIDRDVVPQLNDLSLDPRSSTSQRSRPLPTFPQANFEEGHIPHELSTIQELEEQSTRKLSQLPTLSTTKKRLSSSPIKEDTTEQRKDKDDTETRRQLEFDISRGDNSEVIAGSLSHSSATEYIYKQDEGHDQDYTKDVSESRRIQIGTMSGSSLNSNLPPVSAKESGMSTDERLEQLLAAALSRAVDKHCGDDTGLQDTQPSFEPTGYPSVRSSYDPGVFHPSYSGITIDSHQDSAHTENSDPVAEKSTSSERKTWTDLLTSDTTPDTGEHRNEAEQHVWVEYQSSSGGRKLEKVNVSDLNKQMVGQKSQKLPEGSHSGTLSTLTERREDHGRPKSQENRSSSGQSKDSDTQRRLYELYGTDLPGMDDLNETQATDSSRPKSSTPTSSSRTTVKMAPGVDHAPIRNESFRPLLPDNSRDSDQQTPQGDENIQSNGHHSNRDATIATAKLYGSIFNDLTTGGDDQFAALRSDSSSNNTSPVNYPLAMGSELSQHSISTSRNLTEDTTRHSTSQSQPRSLPQSNAQLSQLIKIALEQDSMSLSQHSLSKTQQSVGASLSQHSITDQSREPEHSGPFTTDIRGITDESDLSLVNYSIMSDRTGNQTASVSARSPRRPMSTSFPEQPRFHSSYTSPKQISMTSQKLMTSPSPSRTMESVDSFSHVTGTPSDDHSQSLLLFEKHEDSLLTSAEYSLLQSLPKTKKDKFAVLSIPADQDKHGADRSGHVRFEPLTEQISRSEEGSSVLQEEDHNGIKSINIQHITDEAAEKEDNETLQRAFEKRRQQFIRNSQKRKEKAKVRAAEKAQQQQEHHVKTLQSWKKSRGLNATRAKGGTNRIDQLDKSKSDREKEEKEMKKRTERLYSRLEEVKQQKQLKERQQQYADNRQRMKEYQQKHQERVKKKMHAKK